ncbi:MAG: hypothetical protein KTR33_00800 [Gammaproteobacteria bacterium]|nr:hypothetical protein [Gammaproteobacteria bacterium]
MKGNCEQQAKSVAPDLPNSLIAHDTTLRLVCLATSILTTTATNSL